VSAPRVGVVGGGILGAVLSLRLRQAGADVTLLERGPSLGGLAASMDFGGHTVDRFYHVIVPSDERMIGLAEELGLADQLRFSPVGAGFMVDGELHDFNGIGDFLRFKPLTPVQRLRLAWFVAQCQLRSSYDGLEDLPLERWLRRHCGAGVTERLWKPLLDSRFDSHWSELPATYLWARTRRMSGARTARGGGEQMGHMIGGHQRLIDAIAQRAVDLGVNAWLEAPVQGLTLDGGRVTGVNVGGEHVPFDLVISTLQPPALRHLLPPELEHLLEPYPQRFLGVVCLVLKVRRSMSPYYAVNICDPTPITTVVEASHVVGTEHTGGHTLLYVPKYCDPGAAEQDWDDRTVYDRFTEGLARVAPHFTHEDVVDWTVQRTRLVEPVHAAGTTPRVAPLWPAVEGLGLASASQIYPRLLNGESVVEMAETMAAGAAERLALAARGEPATTRPLAATVT
jgi:protoporphyrinogen oxidase